MVTSNNNKNSGLIVGNDGVPIQFIPPVPPPDPLVSSSSQSSRSASDKNSLSPVVPNPNAAVMNGSPSSTMVGKAINDTTQSSPSSINTDDQKNIDTALETDLRQKEDSSDMYSSTGEKAANDNSNDPPTKAQLQTSGSINSESKGTPVIPEDLDLRWHSWKCLVCDYFYEGHSKKTVCPRCGNSDPDKFD